MLLCASCLPQSTSANLTGRGQRSNASSTVLINARRTTCVLPQAADMVAVEVRSIKSRLDELSKYIDDPRVAAIRDRVEEAPWPKRNRMKPEEVKLALDEIWTARRAISNVRRDHLKVIRQLDLDITVMSFDEWGREFAHPEEAAAFDALVPTAQHSTDANDGEFAIHLAELRAMTIAAMWPSDEFVVERFHWLSRSHEQFVDQTRYDALIQHCGNALAKSDMASLRAGLIQLDDRSFMRCGDEEMLP